jgi:small subunit ribosomal protein S2
MELSNSNENENKISNLSEIPVFEVGFQSLLDAKAFYGTSCDDWNPKSAPFILCTKTNRQPKRKGRSKHTYLIDLSITLKSWNRAKQFIENTASAGGNFMFVGTQPEAGKLIRRCAEQVEALHVTKKWKGGTLTNLKITLNSIKRLANLEKLIKKLDDAEAEGTSINKKELNLLKKEQIKLDEQYGGIRKLKKLPSALIVFNMLEHKTAIYEAKKLGIPVICVSDTLGNPELSEYFIACNTSSTSALRLFIINMFSAIETGYRKRDFKLSQENLIKEFDTLEEDTNMVVSITATDIPVVYKNNKNSLTVK